MEAVIGVDERGQMVFPKEIREKADIKPQDKLAVIGVENGGGYCCLILMRAEKLEKTVRNILGPMVKKDYQRIILKKFSLEVSKNITKKIIILRVGHRREIYK